ncbi:hypothetical protein [Salinigranum halophilum]|uniref:hypothetical protein n=1 Tax=Salinigranum halophilum TaxID=2565931 RepID=UPI001F250782|nr:hypothetical protein [Salinigranum halophilum]
MSRDTNSADRRIMDMIGEQTRVPILNIEEGDLYVLIGLPIVGLLIGGLSEFDAIVLPLAAAGFVLGVAIVFAAPSHLPATTWLGDVYRYYVTRPRRTYASPKETAGLGTEAVRRTDGGLAAYHPFSVDERTQDLTSVKRAWPGAGAIERTDGAVVGMLELDPANMDFAMSGDWAHLQSVGEAFANNDLDFPLTVHATTRRFPVDRLLESISDRLDDSDVTQAPIFRTLLEEYRETRPEEISGTQQLRYFLAVEVHPRDVYRRHQTEPSPAERLTKIPVVGLLLTPFVTRRTPLTEGDVRAKLFEELNRRCRTIDTGLVTKAPGWTARRVSTTELFVLTMEFWNGEAHEYGRPDAAVRSLPVLDSSPDQLESSSMRVNRNGSGNVTNATAVEKR